MPIIDLYTDYGIDTAPEDHKHYRTGWVNVPCPHCVGTEGFHLGFNMYGTYFFCWRCGPHFVDKTLSKLLNISSQQVKVITKQYRINRKSSQKGETNDNIKINKLPYKHPSGVVEMIKPHLRYLERRNFDPEPLIKTWGLLGTSPTSQLKNEDNIPISYKYRILVPFRWEGKEVSFQCRDYTGKQEKKYMACPMAREIIHHKHILYGNTEAWSDTIICVEGVFDVWRLGIQSCAVMGIQYTREQVKLLAAFKKVFIVFDPEPQAQAQAIKLRDDLAFRGVDSYNYQGLETDPGAMCPEDAKHLLKELKLVSGGFV